MKKFYKALSFLMAVLMVAGIAVVGVSADTDTQTVSGEFKMHVAFSEDTITDTYYYSDDYFAQSGTVGNEHLRTMSAALVFTLYGTSNNPAESFGKLPREIGFDNIVTYDMDKTTKDTMGVVLAKKDIDGKPVVMVALRSDEYGSEWASNFRVGESGDASGFSDAAKLVEGRLKDYLSDKNITSAKFWVTGYSRGGAVANLIARDLNQNLAEYGTTSDDIYAYTFEAPMSSADSTVYENIHNISDCRDVIAKVYPAQWGMHNNGIQEVFGDFDQTMMAKQLNIFDPSFMSDYNEVNVADFLDDFAGFLAANITRETYNQQIEPYASGIADIFFGLSNAEKTAFIDFFKEVITSVKDDSNTLAVAMNLLDVSAGQDKIDEVINHILKHIDKVAAEKGKPVSDEDFEFIRSAVAPLVNSFVPVIRADLAGTMSGGDDALPAFYYIMTFGANALDIIKNHYNYNLFNQLKAMDSNYHQESTEPTEATGATEVTEATEVSESTEPTRATEPTQATEATQPTQPTQATEPTQATDIAKAAPSLKVSAVSLKAGKTSVITVLNRGTGKVTYKSTNTKVAVVNKGKVTALKKGTAKINVTVGKTKLVYSVKVLTSPKLSKSSVTVKKGKTATVKITGKASAVNNVYTNTKIAKVISKNNVTAFKVRGLKKGTTTLKIKVNGVVLKLKVNVK